ncbi:MAG: dephospho-CoA kinase [Litorilinea sp.]
MANTLIIGLTGNIATGKSTVLDYAAAKGAYVIDADKVAHRAMAPDGPAYRAIVDVFGREILHEDDTINRRALGKIVFADAEKLGQLEQIVHPVVFEMTRREIDGASTSVVMLEAVKLLEAGLLVTLCDEVWVVASTPENQIQRLRDNRGMDEADARTRMRMQSPQAAKINQADRVIYNDGSLADLTAQLDRVWAGLRRKYPHRMSSLVAQADS